MDDQGGVSAAGVSIGEAAARLGITTSTLRSWGSRYGVVPSLRTAGGHRRYSAADLVVLDQLQAGVLEGAAPSSAAAVALATTRGAPSGLPPSGPARRGAGPGGRVVAVPGADAATRGLARAAGQLDLDSAEEIILAALRERGMITTWDQMLRPVLVAVGKRWADTGEGIEIEHVLSESALGAMRRRRVELPAPLAGRPVLIASAPGDQHTLGLQALAVGLAERRRSALVIGAQVPLPALAAAARRTRPSAIFVSFVVTGAIDVHDFVSALPRTRPPTPVVVGGAGWPDQTAPELLVASDLAEALELLTGGSAAR